ncbi:MAG: peptidase domain-containing ABC transporter [Methylobacterium sp.]|uniref:peptidase domain-containing ABC transporter n=1 Tax=Methylobacterium sp. TaxID=409 RepID=UPI002586D06D|nr:peptidase domain-containing ABC transporter [Methylobacterium sp.]MBY0299620.1 peptidase domain-containing ABC transporter [Methylobacterium sp.]
MSEWLTRALTRGPRVRTILQCEANECGLAALAMIANFHRHDIDLNYLRALFPLSRNGMSLGSIATLADSLDLDANGYALDGVADLDAVALPAILHWRGNHFVVLEAIRRGRYHVHDPEFGLRVYDRADVEQLFTGVVLEFAPRMTFRRHTAGQRLGLLDILRSARGLGGTVWQISLISVAISLLGLTTPVLLQVALDVVIPQVDLDLMQMLAAGLIVMMLFEAFGQWLRGYVALRASTLLQLQFTRNVVGHAFRLPLSYFELRHPGDFVTRLQSIDTIRGFLVGGLVTSFADIATSVLLVGLMYYYSPVMASITLATLVAVLAMRFVTFPILDRATAGSLEARSQEQARLFDGLQRVGSLKAHNSTELFSMHWFESFARFANLDFRAKKAGLDAELLMHAVIAVSTVTTLYLGITGVIGNTLTIGTLYAFIALRSDFFERVNHLTTSLLQLAALRVHVGRLDDVIGQEPEEGLHEAHFHRTIRKEVRIEDVSIRFGRGEEPILTGATLAIDVARCETIAIMGASGSGKSSLMRILASLAAPAAGSLTVDGAPLSQFGKREYRANLGVVFADDGLFAGTVADNLSLFDPAVSHAQMEAALVQVGLREEIERLPQGYATHVSEEGSVLSTGQRRRLLLARALCRRPKLMLLDEVTANLDPETETALVTSLKAVPAAKVFITHSERLLDQVDRVLRIENGRLIEVPRPPARPGSPMPEAA